MILLSTFISEVERKTFEELYINYRQLMFNVAYRILQNEVDSEDAVHQAFLSIMENYKKYSGALEGDSLKVKVFLVIVTERKSYDILRKNSSVNLYEFDDNSISEDISINATNNKDDVFMGYDTLTLKDAMSKLPKRYMNYLKLYYYVGFSCKEIGKLMGERQETVQRVLSRARVSLKKMLEDDNDYGI